MKLFEMLDSGSLLLILKNYKEQADNKGNSLSLKFDAFKKLFNLDEYGLSTPESLKKWIENTNGAKSIIDTVGIKDINEPNPTVLFKTEKPGKISGQPDTNKATPTIQAMASRAAKKALG